jgi:Flp pilus assembly protein protease CpaA
LFTNLFIGIICAVFVRNARISNKCVSRGVMDSCVVVWLCGCWVLGAGCWVLGAGCWVLGAGCWVLGAGCWVLGVWQEGGGVVGVRL